MGMIDFNKANTSNALLKKYILISVCVIVLLMLSNLGTTLLALYLSKDIKVASNGVLKPNGVDSILKTGLAGLVLDAKQVPLEYDDGQWNACIKTDVIEKLHKDSRNGSITVIHVTHADGSEKSIKLNGNAKRNGDGTGSFSDRVFYRMGCNMNDEQSELEYVTVGSTPDAIL